MKAPIRGLSYDEISSFHPEAEIAAVYSGSPDFASTDWERILECYTLLKEISFSQVAELNRAIVTGCLRGPAEALTALESSAARHDLGRYNLLHITRGHLLAELGRSDEAAEAFALAMEFTQNYAVRRFIQRKLEFTRTQ